MTYEVMSSYSCVIVDTVEAVSEEEALRKAKDLEHSNEELMEVIDFEGVQVV